MYLLTKAFVKTVRFSHISGRLEPWYPYERAAPKFIQRETPRGHRTHTRDPVTRLSASPECDLRVNWRFPPSAHQCQRGTDHARYSSRNITQRIPAALSPVNLEVEQWIYRDPTTYSLRTTQNRRPKCTGKKHVCCEHRITNSCLLLKNTQQTSFVFTPFCLYSYLNETSCM
jgi:hypothetical protein